jgi:hypothetical protein
VYDFDTLHFLVNPQAITNRRVRPPGQVIQPAGNDGSSVTFLCQVTGQFVVTGTAGLLAGDKCLMNQQDVHDQ